MVTERAEFDRESGIPVGYTETVNGVVVLSVRATRLTVVE